MNVNLHCQRSSAAWCAVLALVMHPGPGFSQERAAAANRTESLMESSDQAPQLQEVIVTARKRAERILDVPESITAISSDTIATNGIETLNDVGRQTPNLQMNVNQDLTTGVVIRGVGAFYDTIGVGFTIDDVPNFTDQTMRVTDLESIEILKGPQGTVYGSSAIGGEVIYHSPKPRFDWSGEAIVEAGSYNTLNLNAAQNMPLITDQLALRVSVYDAQSHGYLTNSALGGIDAKPLSDVGVRAGLLYRPTETFSALLTLRHSDTNTGINQYSVVNNVNAFTRDVPYFEPASVKRTTSGAVLKLDNEVGALNLSSISSYTRAQYNENIDVSLSPPGVPGLNLATLPGERPAEVATQEFRVTSPTGGKVDWLAGIYSDYLQNLLPNQQVIQNYPPPPMTATIYDNNTHQVDIAAYGTLNYHVGNFTLGGGARISKTTYTANVFTELGGLPNQVNSVVTKAALSKLTLSYKLSNGALLYANAAEGSQPGAVNVVSTAPVPYKAEKSRSYEAGIKGQASDRKIDYELTAFYLTNTDKQYQTNLTIPPGLLISAISNVGDARSYGVEASTSWRVTPDLTIEASGGYLRAQWQTGSVFGTVIDGNTIPSAPAVTASFSLDYARPVSDKLRLRANFDTHYTSRAWWDLPNTPGTEEPAYWLTDARLSLGPERRSWDVALRVSNLFGSKYWTEFAPIFVPAVNFPTCMNCSDIAVIGPPREFMASVTYKY